MERHCKRSPRIRAHESFVNWHSWITDNPHSLHMLDNKTFLIYQIKCIPLKLPVTPAFTNSKLYQPQTKHLRKEDCSEISKNTSIYYLAIHTYYSADMIKRKITVHMFLQSFSTMFIANSAILCMFSGSKSYENRVYF